MPTAATLTFYTVKCLRPNTEPQLIPIFSSWTLKQKGVRLAQEYVRVCGKSEDQHISIHILSFALRRVNREALQTIPPAVPKLGNRPTLFQPHHNNRSSHPFGLKLYVFLSARFKERILRGRQARERRRRQLTSLFVNK